MAKFIKIESCKNEIIINVEKILFLKPIFEKDLIKPEENKTLICIEMGLGTKEVISNKTVKQILNLINK